MAGRVQVRGEVHPARADAIFVVTTVEGLRGERGVAVDAGDRGQLDRVGDRGAGQVGHVLAVDVEMRATADPRELGDHLATRVGGIEREVFAVPTHAVVRPAGAEHRVGGWRLTPRRIGVIARRLPVVLGVGGDPLAVAVEVVPGVRQADGGPLRVVEADGLRHRRSGGRAFVELPVVVEVQVNTVARRRGVGGLCAGLGGRAKRGKERQDRQEAEGAVDDVHVDGCWTSSRNDAPLIAAAGGRHHTSFAVPCQPQMGASRTGCPRARPTTTLQPPARSLCSRL